MEITFRILLIQVTFVSGFESCYKFSKTPNPLSTNRKKLEGRHKDTVY